MSHLKKLEIYHQENISVYSSAFLKWVFSFMKDMSPHRKMLKISMPGQYILLEGYVLVPQIKPASEYLTTHWSHSNTVYYRCRIQANRGCIKILF